ncbi:DDE-type integrase/transposase/recombinase [Legionella anisa]|uniref:DDE-type integrase/transposase/recombinase n=1 Tax=Legionella anisa TaxID=28082 RepID=UPI000D705FBB|nr:DDE-type integrase/transposase/recombinase [Legionella anisa]AWN75219.1 integrase [Legionella anisa]HAT9163922.1 DDE-type integrase/transposase/recombinase [Legionella pneumophila subsp. pneumophila]
MGQLSMELYLKQLRLRYKKASKSEKTKILQEFCDTSGYHRKHAIRTLNEKIYVKKQIKKRGRKPSYKPELILEPLKTIWLQTNQLCGRRLKTALPLWLPHYEKTYGALDKSIMDLLHSMSSATIDRLLSPLRAKYGVSYGGTKPGSILKKHIPVKTEQWNESAPGFVEADTVAHCGSSMSGEFIWSLTLTDIYSGWTELRAVWNKGSTGIVEQINDIEKTLPFPLKGFDCDNGSEFLNHHLLRYFASSDDSQKHRLQFTRSRPYKKDDNAHVEQKNWTHVRQLLGYYRLDKPSLVTLLNDLYKNEVSLLNNFFLPNFKLIEKTRVKSKVIKKHSAPKTPYQRLLESTDVTQEKKENLTKIYQELNPFILRKVIERKLKYIFSNVNIKVSSKRTAI